ncbi:MAG: ABC transporter permease subunit [Thermotogota bacterium]|nr:ABC transporter permease subunit [Thermotogota bacterium]
MYSRFVIKRLFWGVFSFICIVFMYSCVLNAKLEATACADVVRIVRGIMQPEAAKTIVTMGLLSLATAFAGNIIVEIVFSYHGLGMLLWQAIQTNRIKIMMANLVAITLIYCAALIILDLIYGFLDPRINYNAK